MKNFLNKWERTALIIMGVTVAYKMRTRIVKAFWASKTSLEDLYEEIKAEAAKEKDEVTKPDLTETGEEDKTK